MTPAAGGDVWLVTGGARSGKSGFAERLATRTGRAVVYVATLEPLDDEMRARIERHRNDRPPEWRTVEAHRDLLTPMRELESDACILIDCLSVWVANRLLAAGGENPPPDLLESLEADLGQAIEALLEAAGERTGETIIVTNEVGSGVVPPYPSGRIYRDVLGRVNQQVSRRAARAWLLVAGRALELPPPDAPVP